MQHAEDPPVRPAGLDRPRVVRGTPGFFRVVRDDDGCWWLHDPDDGPFFLRTVHAVRPTPANEDAGFPTDAVARLRVWGFNALGTGGDESLRADGLPFLACVGFDATAPLLSGPGLRLPDVFHPGCREAAVVRAREACAALSTEPNLIGWVSDDALEWATPSPAGRPTLLQQCLSLEPSFPAYHAAWEFVLAHHGGRLELVAAAWNARLPNKETLRELTRAEEGLGTRGYLRDDARWLREFARRYFSITTAAIRAADPNHLVFGCRFARPVGVAILAECAYPHVDVTMMHASELPAMSRGAEQPVVVDAVNWGPEAMAGLPAPRRRGRLTTVERMLRRGRTTLDRLARHRAVVGYAWSRWQDEPGERPPFGSGLVHADGFEACEHTEVLAAFNIRAEALHRTAGKQAAGQRAGDEPAS